MSNAKNGPYYKAIVPCPVYQAQERGWTPVEAVEHGARSWGCLRKWSGWMLRSNKPEVRKSSFEHCRQFVELSGYFPLKPEKS